ncbi:hypothetical protein [Corynebacterium glyciniphilum]|uniref:hypothetical protein n=1 Tax=Corynebacterium glyciniphilum TaxID=1404244 RepID=UPI00264C8EDE|nr:hypothetical protein [Corynebacterium glyciniphilum]MDN6706376.1 hypothetical protein [Corynebacterium glyciniphilum]
MAFTPREDWVDDPNAGPVVEGTTPIAAEDLLRYETGIDEATKAAAAAQRTADSKPDHSDIPDAPDLSSYVTESALNSALEDKADSSAIPDVSGLASESALEALESRIAALESTGDGE